MTAGRFAIRTVKNGCVRVDGRDYRPDELHMAYDGRLDGQRFAFARYEGRTDLLGLWGTEEEYRDPDAEFPDGPHVVDGTLPWMFWSTAVATQRSESGEAAS